jgi:hypothetical protein
MTHGWKRWPFWIASNSCDRSASCALMWKGGLWLMQINARGSNPKYARFPLWKIKLGKVYQGCTGFPSPYDGKLILELFHHRCILPPRNLPNMLCAHSLWKIQTCIDFEMYLSATQPSCPPSSSLLRLIFMQWWKNFLGPDQACQAVQYGTITVCMIRTILVVIQRATKLR